MEYIVRNTVGKQVEGKTLREVAKLSVLDMACGSGSFLLGAYQYLLDWHLRWYTEHEPQKQKRAVYDAERGARTADWRLTTEEKKRILLANIYGVDIDRQAVEVTKLSLLLKVLEDEQGESGQLALLEKDGERVLPDLDKNILCGNSLIGPDYFEGSLLPDAESMKRVNPFDWQAGFPEVMRAGGFDCVIGNPPWGADFSQEAERNLRSNYTVATSSTIDSYALFIESALKRVSPAGIIGYITPDTFLRKDDLLPTRELLLTKTVIHNLVETGPLFSKVRDTWCLVPTAPPGEAPTNDKIRHRKLSRFITSVEERLNLFAQGKWHDETMLSQSVWISRPKFIVGYFADANAQKLIEKMEQHPPLGQQQTRFKISRGEEGSKFAIKSHGSGGFQIVIPADIEKYYVGAGTQVSTSTLTATKVTALYRHPKIWIIRIQKMRWQQRIVCAFDSRRNSAGMKTLQIVVSVRDDEDELKFLSGILSSKLINFWCVNYLADDLNQSYLERIPIPALDVSYATNKARHDRMVSLVERMLDLNKRLQAAGSDAEREVMQRQVEGTDRQIDALVYELYGLTEEEVAVVEGRG